MDEKLYDQKFRELQNYVPFLENLIKGNHASNRSNQVDKMRKLHAIIIDTRKKKLDTLLKCEAAVKSIYEKFQTKVCNTAVNVDLVKREAVKDEPISLERTIGNTPESPPPTRKRDDCSPVVIPTERSQVRSVVRVHTKSRDRSRDRSRDSRERKYDRRRDRSNSRHRDRSSNKRNPFVKERDGSHPSHSPIRILPPDRSDRYRQERSSHKHSHRSDHSHERSAIDSERSNRSTDRSRSGGPQSAAALIQNIKLEGSESSPDVVVPIRKQNHESVFERLGNKTDPKPFVNLKIQSTNRSRSVAGRPYVDKSLEPLNDAEVKELHDDNLSRFGKSEQLFEHMDKNMQQLLAMRETLKSEMRPLQEVIKMNKIIEELKAESRSNSPVMSSGSSNSPTHISGFNNDRKATNKVENKFYASFRQLEATTIDMEKPKSTVCNSDPAKGRTTLLEKLGFNKQNVKAEKPKPSVTEILELHSKTSNMYSNPPAPQLTPPPEPLPSFPSPSPPRSTSPPRTPEPFVPEVSAPVEIFNNDDRLYDMVKQAISTCERQKADEDQTLPIAMKAVEAVFGNDKRKQTNEPTPPVRLAYKYNPRPRKRTEDEPPSGISRQMSTDSNPNESNTSIYKRCGSSFDPRPATTATINTYDSFMGNRSGLNPQQRNNTYDFFNAAAAESPMDMSSPTENSAALLPNLVNSLPCNMFGPPIDPRLRNRDPRIQSVEHTSFSQPSNTSGIFAQAHQTLPPQSNVGIFAQANLAIPSHTSGIGMHMNLTRPSMNSIFPSTQQSFLNSSCTSPTYQPLGAVRNSLLPTPNLGRSPNYHNPQQYPSQHASPSYDSTSINQNKFHQTINDNVERQKYELSKKNKSFNNNTQHQSYGATSERPAGMTYGEYKRSLKPVRKASLEKPAVPETATSTTSAAAITTKTQITNFDRTGNYKAIDKFKIPKLKKTNNITATVVQDSEVGGSTDHEENTSDGTKKPADDVELIEEASDTIWLSDDDDVVLESAEPDTATPAVELSNPVTISDSDSIQVSKKWLDTYLQDFLNPTTGNTQALLSALSRSIEEEKYLQILKIIQSPAVITDAATADNDGADSIDNEMQPIPDDIEVPADDELPVERVVVAKKKRLNELQKLNEDIRTMFISDGVLTATGRRFCTTVQRPDVIKRSTQTPPVTPIVKAKATLANKGKNKTDESDSSAIPVAPKRITRRRCSIKSTAETKSDKEDDSNDSDTTEPSPPKVVKKKTVANKIKEPEVLEVNIPQRISRRRNTLAAPIPMERLMNATKKNKLAKGSKMSKAQSDDDESTAKTKTKARKPVPNFKTAKVAKSKLSEATERSSDNETNGTDDEEYHRRPMRVRPQEGSPTRNLKIVLEKVDFVQTRKRKSNDTASLVVSSKKTKISDSTPVVYPPNTNIKLFPLHKDYKNRCMICDFETARSLVLHYVNEHRDAEVYVSRLASDIAAQLMNPRNKLKKAIVDTRKDEMRFKQQCYFCKKEKVFTHQVWLTHIGTHTGEYQFECKKCTLYQSPYPLNQGSGTNHPCQVKKSDWRRLPMKWKEDDQVHLYVCKLCNYTQLSEDNIQRHLRIQHEASVNDNYTQVLFLRTDKRFQKLRGPNKKKDADAVSNDGNTNDGPAMPLLKNEVTPKKNKLNQAKRVIKSVGTGTTSPYQSDAFTARYKQDDGLFDDDTMRMMNDVSFSSAASSETPPRNASIADRLNERFKSAQKSEQEQENMRNTSALIGEWKVLLPRGLGDNDRPSAAIDGPSADKRERLLQEYDQLKEIDDIAIEFRSPEPECSSPEKTTSDKRPVSKRHDDGNDGENGSVSTDSATEELPSQETNTNSIMEEKPSEASCAMDESEKDVDKREDAVDDNNEEWESCSESDDASVASQTQPEIKKRHKKLSDTVNRLFHSISSRLPSRNRATKRTIKRTKCPEIKEENTDDNAVDKTVGDEISNKKAVEFIPAPLAVNESTALSYAALVMEATDDLDESDKVGQNVAAQDAVEHHGNGNTSSGNSNGMRTFSSTGGNVTTTTKTNSALHYGIDGEDFSNGADSNGQSEPMDQGSGKTINRIDNMGYSIWKNITEYCCMIANCCFETSILGKLLSHLEEHDVNWGGYCFMCDRQVVDDELPLMLEFKHMRETHLVKNEDSDKKPDLAHRPRIHVRRFSTDTLSILPEQQTTPVHTVTTSSQIPQIFSVNSLAPNATNTFLKISSVSGGGDFMPVSSVASATTMQQPPQLMISNVVSMSTKQVELPDDSISINLKPWTKSPPQKCTWLCKKMLRDICLFALYKCMANECYFYTSDPDYMLYHLRNHDKLLEQSNGSNQSMDTTSWLQCSYCDETVDSCTLLVRHIHDEHSTSIFQCPYCFYRSCAAHNVVVHLKIYHNTSDASVFVCIGKAKGLLMTQIAQGRDEHVRSLNCATTECNKSFFVMETFVRHLASSHADEFKCCFCKQLVPTATAASHMLCHGIGLFECVYCLYGTNDVKNIQQHLCNEHPSKLVYVSVRLSRRDEDALQQNIPDSSINKTVLSYIGQPVNKDMFLRCPYSAKQLNVMSPELTAIVNNQDPTHPQPPPIGLRETGLLKFDAIIESDVRNEASSVLLKNVVNISDLAKMHNIVSYELYYRSLDSVVGGTLAPKPQPTPPAPITCQTTTSLFVISNVSGGVANVSVASAVAAPITTPILAVTPVTSKPTKTTKDAIPSIENAVAPRTNQLQMEIDDAAYALVKGTGHEGTDLYRCGFPDCDGNGIDPIYFNVHLLKHTNPGENKNGFKCYHCDLLSKNIVGLKYHIKVHGIHRYFCYYCDYTGPIMNNTLKHMNDTHKKSLVVTFPLNPDKTDQNLDMFVICPRGIRQDELNRFGLKLLERYKHKMATTKKFYSGDEIDLLPMKSIFNELISCSMCTYSTKVRSNMQRHLTAHNEGKNVAKVDTVNPVPCLDTGEKHFDKMKNLACSSNNGTIETSPLSSNPYDPLAFVLDTRRFLCNAKGCRYQTINEAMLRCHLDTLHLNETDYKCPHCNLEINKGPMIVEKVVLHLRMHDSKIFRCPRCPFFHYDKVTVDKHIEEKHVACKDGAVVILRKVEGSAGALPTAIKSTDGQIQPRKYKWKCSLCKETFNMHKEVVNHVRQWHSITFQYECDVCNAVQSNSKQTIIDHLISKHPQDDKRVKFFYEKYESVENDETTPIWRRDDPNKVKHIRGILFEDEAPEEAVKPQKKKANGKARKRPTTSSLNAARMSKEPQPKPLTIDSLEDNGGYQKFEEIMLPEKKPAKLIQPFTIDSSVTVVISDEDSPSPSPPPSIIPHTIALPRSKSPATPPPEHRLQRQAIDDTNTPVPLSEEQFTLMVRLPHTYVCRVCLSYSATTILKLRSHFSQMHPSSTFSVRTTSDFYMCTDARTLAETSSPDTSTDIIKYVCHYCVTRFDKLSDTYKHWCLQHKSSDITKAPAFPFRFRIMKQVRCYFCTLKGSLNDIKVHTFRRHTSEPLVTTDILDLNKCGQCDYKATWSHREIREHYEDKHKAVGTAISNQVRTSDIEYLTQDFLDHLLSEGPKSIHICLLCSEEFNYKDEYEGHHDMAHGMRPQKFRLSTSAVVYNCSCCRNVDHDEKELAKHIRGTHAMLYRCKHCELEFMYLNLIEEHYLVVHQVKNKRYLCASVERMRNLFENIQLTFPNGLILSKSELRYTTYGDVDSLVDHVRDMNEAELQLQRLRQEKLLQKSSIDKAKREISEARRDMKEAEREKELAESHRRQTEPLTEEIQIPSSAAVGATKKKKEEAQKIKLPAEPKKRARKRLASDVSSDATSSSRASKASMSSKGTRHESPAPSGAAPAKRKRQRKKRHSFYDETDSDADLDADAVVAKMRKEMHKSGSSEDEPLAKLMPQEHSVYGQPVKPVDLSAISTYIPFCESQIKVTCDRLAALTNINPTLQLIKVRPEDGPDLLAALKVKLENISEKVDKNVMKSVSEEQFG